MRIVAVTMAASCLWLTADQAAAIELESGDDLRVPLSVAYRFSGPLSEPPLGSSISFHRDTGGRIVARRILSDPLHHRYFGYEALLEPQGGADGYLVSFHDLDPLAANLPLGEWTLQPATTYPPPRVMHEGDTIYIAVGTVEVNANANERIEDDILLARTQPVTQGTTMQQTYMAPLLAYANLVAMELRKRGLQPAEPDRTATVSRVVEPNGTVPTAHAPAAPPIVGSPRLFTAADAELWIVNPGFTVNGRLASTPGSLNSAHGRLIFIYMPGKGRYILSLLPRPELGFTRGGEVSGGFLTWAAEGDTFGVDSTLPIAAEGGPWFVYELHDPDWQPVTPPKTHGFLLGSVGPEEIASLRKGAAK
jgi:hypothetical protein